MIAGVMKSGSTSVYHYLKQHPEIYMSSEKEPDFFNYNYEKGEGWYLSHFKNVKNEKAIGEASVRMFNMYEALKMLKKFNPEIKLIFVFRNPVERLYSNYMYDLSKGIIRPYENFSKIIRDKSWRWYNGYVDLGYYYKHCSYIEKLFPKENILYTLQDDLKTDPHTYCKRIFKFLNVDDSYEIDFNLEHNITVYPNNLNSLESAFRFWDPMRNIMNKSKLKFILDNTLQIRGKLKRMLFYNGDDKLQISEEDNEYLTDLYSDSIDKLQLKINRDLSHWKRKSNVS